MNYNQHFCAPARAGSLAECWQQRGPGSAAACDKLPMSDRVAPLLAVRSRIANSHVPKTHFERATLWPSVSERLNLVVIDLGHPPGTQISERAVTLTIQLQPSVTRCRYLFPI